MQPIEAGFGEVPTLLGHRLAGPIDTGGYLVTLDRAGLPMTPVTIPIEVKNIRSWIYPSSEELYQLLSKCVLAQRKAGPKVQHREDNLWLRSLNVEIPDPPGVREFGIESRLTRENVVERAGVRIHDLHMEAVATHGVRVRGKLAYREGAGDIPIELTEGSVVGARPNIRLKGVR